MHGFRVGEVWGEKKARVCMGLGWEGFGVREKARVCFKSGTKEKAMSACTYVGEE